MCNIPMPDEPPIPCNSEKIGGNETLTKSVFNNCTINIVQK
jgi:hypothetical protein